MAKTKDKSTVAVDALKPYVKRAMEDPELRDDLVAAFVAARSLYGQISKGEGVRGKAEKISEKDFQKQVLNDAPKQWLQMPNGDLTEPWLFLIGADGTIADRWSSMWSEDEVEAELDALPPMQA